MVREIDSQFEKSFMLYILLLYLINFVLFLMSDDLNLMYHVYLQSLECVRKPLHSRFRYTLDAAKLTHNQREFYERNGFLVIKGLVSHDKIDRYR